MLLLKIMFGFGANATILKEAIVDKDSIISSDTIVTSDVPANSIAADVPAKIVRTEVK